MASPVRAVHLEIPDEQGQAQAVRRIWAAGGSQQSETEPGLQLATLAAISVAVAQVLEHQLRQLPTVGAARTGSLSLTVSCEVNNG